MIYNTISRRSVAYPVTYGLLDIRHVCKLEAGAITVGGKQKTTTRSCETFVCGEDQSFNNGKTFSLVYPFNVNLNRYYSLVHSLRAFTEFY